MNNRQRREFLKIVGAGTVGAASLGIGGAGAQPARPRIKIGQIGVGHGHANKLAVFRRSADYEVVGVAEPDAALRQRAEGQEVYRSLPWLTQESGGSSDRVGEAVVEGGSAEPPIGGTWRVRYLRDFAAVPNSSSALELVDNPALFDPPGPVRFLVEFELTVGDQAKIWNPPWVDFVRLTWEQPPVSSGAAGGDR